MSTSSINSTYTSSITTTSSSSTSSLGDFDTFLQLLITELQYQDPTDPVDNTELVSQMAQLNTLEQLNTINTNLTFYQATSLIGQEITYQVTDSSGSTTTATGTVASVITSGGETYLNIDGSLISPSAVLEVTANE